MRKFLTLFTVLLLYYVAVFSQTQTISGKVTDSKGQPVPFATVRVKGTKTGVSANADGDYQIKAAPGNVLVVSGAGIAETEMVAGNGPLLNITVAQKDANLQEVVVSTALGIRRSKNELPYAAQVVTASDLTKTREDNFMNSLSGKAAGLVVGVNNNLGGSTNVILRGYKSITGNNQALFVVDGIPINNSNTNTADQRQGRNTTGLDSYDYGSPAADINPDDIESVNVLKGAASSALYGSRGANGVILITTKHGRKGTNVTLNLGGSAGSMDKSTWIKYQHQYGAGYYDPDYYTYSDSPPSPDSHFLWEVIPFTGQYGLVTPSTEDASFGAKFDPNLMVWQWSSFAPTMPQYGKAQPWVAAKHDPTYFFESPVNSSASLFVDGGGDRGNFKLGYTRNTNKGMLPNSNLTKNILNFSASYDINNKLTVSASAAFSVTNALGRYGNGYGNAQSLAGNFRQWWEMNNDVYDLKTAYFSSGRQNMTWNAANLAGGDFTAAYWDNPYFVRYTSYENDQRNRFIGYVAANYKLTSWLSVLGRASVDNYQDYREQRIGVGSNNVSAYQRYDGGFQEFNYDGLLTVNKDIGSSLNIKALAGVNFRRGYWNSVTGSTNGGLVVPGFYSLANSASPIAAPLEDYERQAWGSVFGGVTLSWKGLLILDATERVEQASTLPSNANKYNYPSVSAGFVFSKLMPDATWLSLGKLRLNYASVGGGAPFAATYDVYNNTTNGDNSVPNSSFGNTITTAPLYATSLTKNNPTLKPEITDSYEGGLELSLFKSRVGLDFTYFTADSKNQIMPIYISYATGYVRKYVNAGVVRNKGIEVSLNLVPVETRNFRWDLRVNYSRQRNKVISLFPGTTNLLIAQFQGGVSLNATLGHPFGDLRGSDFIYTNGKRTVDDDGYYEKSSSTDSVIGNINPDWFGGLSNTFTYKEFSLSFLIDVRKGGSIYSNDQWYGQGTGLPAWTAGKNDKGNPLRDDPANGGGIRFPGVTEDGKENTTYAKITGIRGLGYNNWPNAGFIYDASYVKLREVSITYSIPGTVFGQKKFVKGVDISVYGRNLWIIHKNLPDADPEDAASSGNIQGFQIGSYPTYRMFGANLKFKF